MTHRPGHKQEQEKITYPNQTQIDFFVPLSFDQEIINNNGTLEPLSLNHSDDNITAALRLTFDKKLSSAKYKLYVFNATNPNNQITMAHLHYGNSNVNGPIVVVLFPGIPQNVNGLLSQGTITNAKVYKDSKHTFNTIAALYQAILSGNIYVNVHSQRLPDGTARGQIFANVAEGPKYN